MGILQLLILLVIAGICGAIAELVVGFSPGGFVVSIIIGVIGAYLGHLLAESLDLPQFLTVRVGNQPIEIIWAILGSIVLLLVISLFRSSSRRRASSRRGRLF